MALRRLRKFARQGNDLELDMDDTIKSTAKNAGYLDIKMVPERLNSVKVIVMFGKKIYFLIYLNLTKNIKEHFLFGSYQNM